jgi:hypothetical protein
MLTVARAIGANCGGRHREAISSISNCEDIASRWGKAPQEITLGLADELGDQPVEFMLKISHAGNAALRCTTIRWRHSSSLGRDGIKPAQPAKPCKITIGGAQRKPVFHGKRSQMSVWYKIAMYAGQREKLTQQLGVSFRRLRYPCCFACEPRMDLLPRIANWFRTFEHARIGHQAKESEHALPR